MDESWHQAGESSSLFPGVLGCGSATIRLNAELTDVGQECVLPGVGEDRQDRGAHCRNREFRRLAKDLSRDLPMLASRSPPKGGTDKLSTNGVSTQLTKVVSIRWQLLGLPSLTGDFLKYSFVHLPSV